MVTIRDIKTICTAPEGINLLVVKVETSEPGLYGLGCGTFAYRHLAVKLVVEEYPAPAADRPGCFGHQRHLAAHAPERLLAQWPHREQCDLRCGHGPVGHQRQNGQHAPVPAVRAASAGRACRCTATSMAATCPRSARTSPSTVRSASRPSAASAAVTAAASTAIPRAGCTGGRKARRVSGRQCLHP